MIEHQEQATFDLVVGAVGFRKAAELVHRAEPGAWITVLVNLGFSIELALKAYMLSQGDSRSKAKKIGHDLNKLLARCEELGFKVKSDFVREVIEDISPHHEDMTLRYAEVGDLRLFPAETMLEVVWTLVRDAAIQGGIVSPADI